MQALLSNDIINHPAIQAGAIPFLLALLAGALLPRRLPWWSALVFAIGYFCAAWLILDGRLTPLTSPRKLVILGAAAVVVGLAYDALRAATTRLRNVPLLLAVAGVTWLIWPKLASADNWQRLLMFSAAGGYAVWLCFALRQLQDEDIGSSISATLLGLASGICALLGASALLGELAIAVGSGAAAIALFGLTRRIDHGSGFNYTVAVLTALIGIAAVLYAKVPWYALVALAGIPLLAMLLEWRYTPAIGRIVWLTLLTSIPAAIAIGISWRAAGPIPL